MKKKNLRILTVTLIVALIVGTIGITTWATRTVPQTTYMDFEDGICPFYLPAGNGNMDQVSSSTAIATENTGNTVLKVVGGKLSKGVKGDTPYAKDSYFTSAAGLTNAQWQEGTRPTKVQFSFKTGDLTNDAGQTATISFHPLQTNGYGYYGCKMGIQVNPAMGAISFNNASYFYQQFKYVGDKPATAGSIPYNKLQAPEDAPWYEFECVYDWSDYNAENHWQVVLTYSITDGINTIVCSQVVQYQAPTNPEYTYGSDPAVGANTTYTIGFEGTSSANYFGYVDDVRIWSESVSDTSVTYSPDPQVKALGALNVENEETGEFNIRSSFDMRVAIRIAKGNDEVITHYGALAVAGTKNSLEMKEALESALAGTVPEGYKLLKNAVVRTADVPDIYTVTVNNSGEMENMGRRMSCIGYIVTDKGVYFSQNNNTAMGVSYGVVNKSVMGLLKEAFVAEYLNSENLNAVLMDYNVENGTSYTVSDLQRAATKEGVSTVADRQLLQGMLRALIESGDAGGSEMFPGNW